MWSNPRSHESYGSWLRVNLLYLAEFILTISTMYQAEIKRMEGRIKNPRLSNTKTLRHLRILLRGLDQKSLTDQDTAAMEAMREVSWKLRPGMMNTLTHQVLAAHRHCAKTQRQLLMNEEKNAPKSNLLTESL